MEQIGRDQATNRLSFVDAAVVAVTRRHAGAVVASFDADFVGLDGVRVVPGPQP